MMVLNYKCKRCDRICNAIHFQQYFESWTSGSNDIDIFIQNTQLSAHDDASKALEWIPYDRFYDIKYIEKIGVFRANWIDGYISHWNRENENWIRFKENMSITLKSLDSSNDVTLEFMYEVLFINFKF
jgi:hypothetical protein